MKSRIYWLLRRAITWASDAEKGMFCVTRYRLRMAQSHCHNIRVGLLAYLALICQHFIHNLPKGGYQSF
ncbi:MAG: hypothetical protein CO013_06335 [Syntrophobacterales bacterium CG_4_8_14_3_um_filter_58_8]|nr:MAG: hypothetical protein CO013_06335 [Syntrophobacterales bacterium CG_4_8_14_3_um_filter_58_8]